MLRKLLQSAAVAAVLAMVPVMQAKADTCQAGQTQAVFGSFNFCFTFSFTNTSFSVTYNSSNVGAVMTDVGIGGYTGTFANTGVNLSNWSIDAQCTGLGGLSLQLCADANSQPGGVINNGVTAPGTVTLSFTGVTTSSTFAWVHLQDVNGTSCSLKISSSGQVIGSASDCPTTTVPEPASLFLVGTGLVGIGGLVRRRRRKDT